LLTQLPTLAKRQKAEVWSYLKREPVLRQGGTDPPAAT
jgi:hypothetical protein